MPQVTIDADRCKGCALCVTACPKQIVIIGKSMNSKGYYYAEVSEPKECIACALCARMCPDCAIKVER